MGKEIRCFIHPKKRARWPEHAPTYCTQGCAALYGWGHFLDAGWHWCKDCKDWQLTPCEGCQAEKEAAKTA